MRYALLISLSLLGCAPEVDITTVTLALSPPDLVEAAQAKGEVLIPLPELSAARGTAIINVELRTLTLEVTGLPRLPAGASEAGVAYRLWIGDAKGGFSRAVDVVEPGDSGRATLEAKFGASTPLEEIRWAVVVAATEEASSPRSGGSHSGPGWALVGEARDLPKTSAPASGHQH